MFLSSHTFPTLFVTYHILFIDGINLSQRFCQWRFNPLFLNLYETVILKLWALYFSGNKKDDSSEKRIRHLKISFIILNLLLKQTSLVQDSMDMLCKSKLIYWKAWFSVLVVYCVLDEKACRPLTNITDLNFLSYWHTVFLLHYYMLSLYANDLLFEERNYILNCFLNY